MSATMVGNENEIPFHSECAQTFSLFGKLQMAANTAIHFHFFNSFPNQTTPSSSLIFFFFFSFFLVSVSVCER